MQKIKFSCKLFILHTGPNTKSWTKRSPAHQSYLPLSTSHWIRRRSAVVFPANIGPTITWISPDKHRASADRSEPLIGILKWDLTVNREGLDLMENSKRGFLGLEKRGERSWWWWWWNGSEGNRRDLIVAIEERMVVFIYWILNWELGFGIWN